MDAYTRLQSAANKVVASVFGPQAPGRKDDLTQEVIAQWLEFGGDLNRLPESAVLLPQLRAFATSIRRAERGTQEREVSTGRIEAAGDVEVIPHAAAVEAEAAAEGMQGLLAQMSKTEAGLAKATLVGLHLGNRVLPEQPRALLGDTPYQNLQRYHALSAEKRCPTCRAIARYVRVPGMGPDQVKSVVDSFLYEARARSLG